MTGCVFNSFILSTFYTQTCIAYPTPN